MSNSSSGLSHSYRYTADGERFSDRDENGKKVEIIKEMQAIHGSRLLVR
jgi:hypothetical protein